MRTQRSLLIAFSVAFASFGLLVSFQNCGADFGAAQSSSLGYSTSITYPFTAKTDLFGYMSCDRMQSSYDRNQYFTFRLRSNGGNSGIQPSAPFLATVGKFNTANKIAAVTASGFNGATLQFSVRSPSSLQSYLFSSGLTSDSAGEISNWGPLTSTSNLTTILNSGSYGVRSLNGSNMMVQVSGNGDNLGAHADAYANSSGMINQIAGGTLQLMLGYYSPQFANGQFLLNPAMSTSAAGGNSMSAYGSNFKPVFAKPYLNSATQTTTTGHGYFTVQSLNEYDPSTPTPTNIPGWTCLPYQNQFMILPNSDSAAARANCMSPAAAAATTYTDAESLRRFNAANALLNDGVKNRYWIIDANNNCVFPAQTGSLACYDADGNGALDAPFVANPTESCGSQGLGLCPHYFTFCAASR